VHHLSRWCVVFTVFILQFAAHQTPSSGSEDKYYGLHATMDVYGHKLKHGQLSSTTFWIFHDGDGNASSLNAIQVGWHVSMILQYLLNKIYL
jgi:hypothetical protein